MRAAAGTGDLGYTAPQGSRTGFGALLLGYHDAKKKLIYAGRVGTGFNVRLLEEMHERLRKMEVGTPPTATLPPARERRLARWVRPELVGRDPLHGVDARRDAQAPHVHRAAIR